MTVDTRDLYPDSMAEEDFNFLVAIVQSLTEKMRYFYISLPGDAYLSNHPMDGTAFRFAGIDAIKEAHAKVMEIDATQPHVLVMPTNMPKKINVGRIFGMNVWADPQLQKDAFTIMREEDYIKNT